MSSTPRSDEESFVCDKGTVVSIYFAETLERELAAMKSENDELNKLLSEQQANWEKDLKKCSDELARATESSMAGLRREQQRLADELRSVTAERDELRNEVTFRRDDSVALVDAKERIRYLEMDLSEKQRPLDAEMARLNANLIEANEELVMLALKCERMRPVVEAAQKCRADWTPAHENDLIKAVETYEATK